MIPAAFVTAWSTRAPWPSPAQVEQDLLLSRVLIELYHDDYLGNELVFRGGTCLHKLHLPIPRRYSEDLDFVRQTSSGIAPLTKAVSGLGHRLGFDVSTRISQHPKIYLRTTAADGTPLRIKVEINTHERTPARPLISIPHVVDSPWWSGHGDIVTLNLCFRIALGDLGLERHPDQAHDLEDAYQGQRPLAALEFGHVALADAELFGHLLLAQSLREASLLEQASEGLRARDAAFQ